MNPSTIGRILKNKDKTREHTMSAVPMMLTISQNQGKVDGGDGKGELMRGGKMLGLPFTE